MAHWVSWHVSPSMPKKRTQKYQKSPIFTEFEEILTEIFKIESIRFSRNFVLKKFPFHGTLGFLISFSVDPRKTHSKIAKITHLYINLSWYSRKFSKLKVFVFLNFLEILFKKNFHFMARWASWYVSLWISENRAEKEPKPPLYNNLKLIFPKIFKNKGFCFSQFSRIFVLKKFPFYDTLGLSTCFSVDSRKHHSKTPKITSVQHFEIDISGNFQK